MATLMTGVTGFLGSELLPRWLAARPGEPVHCLVRARSAQQLAARRENLLEWSDVAETERERVHFHAGDLTRPDLGLADGGAGWASEIDEILHVAACTRFDLSLERARSINVEGLNGLLGLAKRIRRLRRLHFVSTAYAEGVPQRDGQPPKFRNSYEQSKREAEWRLQEHGGDVPWTIYRPSIIVGHRETGRTPHFRVLYEPMKWVVFARLEVLPCRPDVRLDVVPVDWVADGIVEIGSREDTAGGLYPLTCGREKAISIQQIIDLGVPAGNRWLRAAGQPEVVTPRAVTPEELMRSSAGGREDTEKTWAKLQQAIEMFLPYMLQEQTFEPEALPADLAALCPSLRDYLAPIIEYALSRGFRDRDA